MLFEDFKLIEPLYKALKAQGYEKPTKIQEKAIPSILARRDVLGCAQTGTGKTAAFAIPILQILSSSRKGRLNQPNQVGALVLAPTRELAVQIGESFKAYGSFLELKSAVVFGGVDLDSQIDELDEGVDILIATPGRLLDLMSQGFVNINKVEIFVLDEADRMLDMGMSIDVSKVINNLPKKRQNLLFSATMPIGVSDLVTFILNTPVKIEIKPDKIEEVKIKQEVYFVDELDKLALLINILKNKSITSALVFARTKARTDRATRALVAAGITAESIHGDKSQKVRQETIEAFKNKEFRVLVATDVAARGIDIEELSHVINYDLPNLPETYVHRIGRTGRAGKQGIAISLCIGQEKVYLKAIENLIKKPIQIVKNHPYAVDLKYKSYGKAPQKPSSSKAKVAPKKNKKREFENSNSVPEKKQSYKDKRKEKGREEIKADTRGKDRKANGKFKAMGSVSRDNKNTQGKHYAGKGR